MEATAATLIAIPTGQSYQIVINCGLNCAEAYSLFCDAIFEGVRLPKKGIFRSGVRQSGRCLFAHDSISFGA